jgi:hypothetical protein
MSVQVPSWMQEVFETAQDVLFLLDEDMCIAKCNPAWDEFAAANGGVGISGAAVEGRSIFEFIPDALVEFYEKKYNEARQAGRWVGFDYECSSPEEFRLFHMALRLVPPMGLLVVNSYLADQSARLPPTVSLPANAEYVSPGGVITMCAHCRRTRRRDDVDTWDWVSRHLRVTGLNVSHGLCPRCTAYLYPELASTNET